MLMRKELITPEQLQGFRDAATLKKWLLQSLPAYLNIDFIHSLLSAVGTHPGDLIRRDWDALLEIFQVVEIALLICMNGLEQLCDEKLLANRTVFQKFSQRANEILTVKVVFKSDSITTSLDLKVNADSDQVKIFNSYVKLDKYLKVAAVIITADHDKRGKLAVSLMEELMHAFHHIYEKTQFGKEALLANSAEPDTYESWLAKINEFRNHKNYNDKMLLMNKKINTRFTQQLKNINKKNFSPEEAFKTGELFYIIQTANTYVVLALIAAFHWQEHGKRLNPDAMHLLSMSINTKGQFEIGNVADIPVLQYVDFGELKVQLARIFSAKGLPQQRLKNFNKLFAPISDFQSYLLDIFNHEHPAVQDRVLYGEKTPREMVIYSDALHREINHYREEVFDQSGVPRLLERIEVSEKLAAKIIDRAKVVETKLVETKVVETKAVEPSVDDVKQDEIKSGASACPAADFITTSSTQEPNMFSASSYPLSSPIGLTDFTTPETLQRWVKGVLPDYFDRELITADMLSCIAANPDPNHKVWDEFARIFYDLEICLLFAIKALDWAAEEKIRPRIIGWEDLLREASWLDLQIGGEGIQGIVATTKTSTKINFNYIKMVEFNKTCRQIRAIHKHTDALMMAIPVKMGIEAVKKKLRVIEDAVEIAQPDIDTQEMVAAKINFMTKSAPFEHSFLQSNFIHGKLKQFLRDAKDPTQLARITVERASLVLGLKVANNYICRLWLVMYNEFQNVKKLEAGELQAFGLALKGGNYQIVDPNAKIFFQYIDLTSLTKALQQMRSRGIYQTKAFEVIWERITDYQKSIEFIYRSEHEVTRNKILYNADGTLSLLGLSDFENTHALQTQHDSLLPTQSEATSATSAITSPKPAGAKKAASAHVQTSSAPNTPTLQPEDPAPASPPKKPRFKKRHQSVPDTVPSSPIVPLQKTPFEILLQQVPVMLQAIKTELSEWKETQKTLTKNKLLNHARFEDFSIEVLLFAKNLQRLQIDVENTCLDFSELKLDEGDLRRIKGQLLTYKETLVSNKNHYRELQDRFNNLLFQEKNNLGKKCQVKKVKPQVEAVVCVRAVDVVPLVVVQNEEIPCEREQVKVTQVEDAEVNKILIPSEAVPNKLSSKLANVYRTPAASPSATETQDDQPWPSPFRLTQQMMPLLVWESVNELKLPPRAASPEADDEERAAGIDFEALSRSLTDMMDDEDEADEAVSRVTQTRQTFFATTSPNYKLNLVPVPLMPDVTPKPR